MNEILQKWQCLIGYNRSMAKAALTTSNTLEIFTDGKAFYKDLAREVENAHEYIHILSYIIKRDEVLEAFENDLALKVKEGVRVRVLVDALGSRTLRKNDYLRLRKKGIAVGVFRSQASMNLLQQVNHRNHRKIIVIDGKSGYVGGFNIGREYLGRNEKLGYWRDTHLKLQGAAVQSLNRCFKEDWKAVHGKMTEDLTQRELPGRRKAAGDSDVPKEVPVQIVPGGPDTEYRNIRNNYLMIFTRARKNIYIQTPYFVPDKEILQALEKAAVSGVDVRLMIPSRPDHIFVHWVTGYYAGKLLDAGVKCYTYDNGFLHAKGVVADGEVSCYGTANMDVRSFRLNFEVNAVIYDRETAGRMEEIFLEDIHNCTELTKERYENRSLTVRIRERVSLLFRSLL